jgi:hypothetical protein
MKLNDVRMLYTLNYAEKFQGTEYYCPMREHIDQEKEFEDQLSKET